MNRLTATSAGKDGLIEEIKCQYSSIGRRLWMTDATGKTEYWYDEAGRLARERSGGIDKRYTYNPSGTRNSFVSTPGEN